MDGLEELESLKEYFMANLIQWLQSNSNQNIWDKFKSTFTYLYVTPTLVWYLRRSASAT